MPAVKLFVYIPRWSSDFAAIAERLRAALGLLAVRIDLARLEIDRATYTDTKNPVCDLIIIAADAWAQQTDWQPGPSDG